IGELADSFRSTVRYITDVSAGITRLAEGDFSQPLAARSERDALAHQLAYANGLLERLVRETGRITEGADRGDLDIRIDENTFSGGYRELVHGLNATLDAVVL